MNKKTLAILGGWTLSETLITMIVAGIVFIAVMDGVRLFSGYSGRFRARVDSNSRLYEGYYRLEHLVSSADSATLENGAIILWREGNRVVLVGIDSILIARTGDMTDTLMVRVTETALMESGSATTVDTVCVTVSEPGGRRLRLSFPLKPDTGRIAVEKLKEQEIPYAYE